jgi:hypothetical protein
MDTAVKKYILVTSKESGEEVNAGETKNSDLITECRTKL